MNSKRETISIKSLSLFPFETLSNLISLKKLKTFEIGMSTRSVIDTPLILT